jgi:hypothetical protein
VSPAPAEHARFHDHIRELSHVSDIDECRLLETVLGDSDQVMAESAVLRHLDRKAATLENADAFEQWSRRVSPVLDQHALLARRLRDWSLHYAIIAGGHWSAADLIESSDWLQRKVAEHVDSPAALIALAEHGRTNRVRNEARSRLNRPSE